MKKIKRSISVDDAVLIARNIVASDANLHQQTFSMEKQYFLGPAFYSIMGTQQQFVRWCGEICKTVGAKSLQDKLHTLNSVSTDPYSICRAFGISYLDYSALCEGRLQADIGL